MSNQFVDSNATGLNDGSSWTDAYTSLMRDWGAEGDFTVATDHVYVRSIHAESGAGMMMAWMNRQAFEQTLQTGKATFYSRSRDTIWVKGESSGHVQHVEEVRVDCDQDVILLRVRAAGPACHVGYPTCFYRAVDEDGKTLRFVQERAFDPNQVYGQ